MRTIVLIGGMGSGKSTASRLLEQRGARRIDLDDLGHLALEDPEIIDALVSRFGEQVAKDGKISRPALAERAFSDREETRALCSITHPAIVRLACGALEQAEREGCDAAVLEVSAFNGPEGPFARLVDLSCGVVAVRAPLDARVARAVARGFSEEDVRSRIASQPSDEERAGWADRVIDNSGSLSDLESEIDSVWNEYFL